MVRAVTRKLSRIVFVRFRAPANAIRYVRRTKRQALHAGSASLQGDTRQLLANAPVLGEKGAERDANGSSRHPLSRDIRQKYALQQTHSRCTAEQPAINKSIFPPVACERSQLGHILWDAVQSAVCLVLRSFAAHGNECAASCWQSRTSSSSKVLHALWRRCMFGRRLRCVCAHSGNSQCVACTSITSNACLAAGRCMFVNATWRTHWRRYVGSNPEGQITGVALTLIGRSNLLEEPPCPWRRSGPL
jgi:hypothetical protein